MLEWCGFVEARSFIAAAQTDSKSQLLEMISSGTDPSIRDDKGRTALHVAAARGLPDIGVYTVTLFLYYNPLHVIVQELTLLDYHNNAHANRVRSFRF